MFVDELRCLSGVGCRTTELNNLLTAKMQLCHKLKIVAATKVRTSVEYYNSKHNATVYYNVPLFVRLLEADGLECICEVVPCSETFKLTIQW